MTTKQPKNKPKQAKKRPVFDKPLSYKLLLYIGYILAETSYLLKYKSINQAFNTYYQDSYKENYLRKEMSVLRSLGLIEEKTYYRRPYPSLTQKGRLEIKTHLNYHKLDPWDGKWRMVIFDIPEKDRRLRWGVRHKLAELGFGQIQKSAYISPYPYLGVLSRYASTLGVRQYLRLLEVSKIDDEKKLVEKTWDLERVNRRYESFLTKAQIPQNDTFWPLKAKMYEEEFKAIYNSDPKLPEEFLPENWAGVKSYKKFKEISNSY